MGRHAGFLTASSVFARKYEDDGPHLIYLPEKTFDFDEFLSSVEKIYSKYGRAVVAVSEGIQMADGTTRCGRPCETRARQTSTEISSFPELPPWVTRSWIW